MKKLKSTFSILFVLIILTVNSVAQDATKVDPKHYKVEFENEFVRVLRITYAPGEKSVMHEHPNAVGVALKSGKTKMTLPDGKTKETSLESGKAFWNPAGKHLPENIGKESSELILVELKTKKDK